MKIAVFVDFDNIEIGVKTTLGGQFDIGLILEAIKERGEVVTKVAYGDWKRAGDHGRLLSQHAIRMVQRNLTPGGDKNGADINLALDALEMAFTHAHINAFVIVGGDSDFITLVEKLKQYDRKVFVVGGRQFTSLVMQRNCHEFIAYENLLGSTRRAAAGSGGGGSRARSGAPAALAPTDVEKALPLVKRALKVLADREVTPQLGLLKSTLLQLDSTFSERDYGTGSFRDFIEKVAERGMVTLKQAGRSVLVELADNAVSAAVPDTVPQVPAAEPVVLPRATPQVETAVDDAGLPIEGRPAEAPAAAPEQSLDAVRTAARLFATAKQTPRWPMYIRQVRQYLRIADETFDERRFGFAGIVEFLRACQKEGILRLDRDRQGVIRVFPGPQFSRPAVAPGGPTPEAIEDGAETPELPPGADVVEIPGVETATAEVVVVDAGDVVVDAEVTPAPEPGEDQSPARPRSRRGTRGGAGRTAKKTAAPAAGTPRTPRAPRAPRARKTVKKPA